MNRKIISAAVAAAVICGAVPMTVSADETAKTKGGPSVSIPHFSTTKTDKNGNPVQVPSPSVSYGTGSKGRAARESYPSSFDLRDYGLITSVKDQNPTGTCWAHAAITCAEASVVYSNPLVDLSEMHTAFYTYYGDDQILGWSDDLDELLQNGGRHEMVVNLWSQGIGPVSDKVLPLYNRDFVNDESKIISMRHESDYRLKESRTFDFDHDKTNADEVNALAKRFLMEGKPLYVSYCSSESNYNDEYCTANGVKLPKFADHAVTIVGWDDNYPAENFDITPSQDGAWLIKNSWGEDFGIDGYFWLSYEDRSLGEFTTYELDDSDEYSWTEYYDTFTHCQDLWADSESDTSFMANVFYNYGDGWQVEAVSTYVDSAYTEYSVTVYTDLTDPSDPMSGTPTASTYAYFDTAGYYTIELDENAMVNDDEYYSVVIEAYNPYWPYVIPFESCNYVYDEGEDTIINLGDVSYGRLIEYRDEGVSFYWDGSEWCDMTQYEEVFDEERVEEILQAYEYDVYDGIDPDDEEAMAEAAAKVEDMIYTYSLGPSGMICGNIPIKVHQNLVNTVDFSKMSGCVDEGEAIYLSEKNNDEIYYSFNGEDFYLYEEPISIYDLTYITATSDFEHYTTRSYIPYDLFIDTPYGDVDADGTITPLDASMVLTHYACLATGLEGPIGKAIIENADYDFDGTITPLDASLILSRYAELSTSAG